MLFIAKNIENHRTTAMFLYAVISATLVIRCVTVQLPLTYSIDEEQPSGTIAADVRRDSGLSTKHSPSELSTFSFKFLKQRPEFTMNATTGVIRIANPLDRDVICPSQKACVVEVDVAVFRGQHVAHVIKVLFNVQDINDNAPRFPQNHKYEFISEATAPGVLFPIQQAEDVDSPDHGIVDYQLISEGPTFGLKKEKGEDGYFDLHLVLKQPLDREQQDIYQLTIVAIDGGRPSKSGSVMMHVEISDIDDNDPVFVNGTYSVEIAENLLPQTSLLLVRATDADLGRNGDVLYMFSPRTFSLYGDRFSIDRYSGLISLLKPLDYEHVHEISLEVEAKGEGEASVPVTATVLVTVRDVNDNDPIIHVETTYGEQSGHSSVPVVYVTEHCPVGTFVAHFSVTDADGGNNGRVHCSLHSPHFRLSKKYDTEFTILTDADLDREYDSIHHVVVTCQDMGQSVRSSFINITVVIDDVNDNAPVFTQAVYNWSIAENNPLNVLIGQVTAFDPDKVRISLSLLTMCKELSIIDTSYKLHLSNFQY